VNEVVRRLAALAVAVGLVGGAVWVRARLDDRPAPDVRTSAAPTAEASVAPTADPERTLRCPRDIAELCLDLVAAVGDELAGGVATAPAAVTLDELADPSAVLDGDVWLVPPAWPAMVDDARERVGAPRLFSEPGEPVASSPVVLGIWTDRAAVLETACGGAIGWDCIGRVAPGTWADIGGPAAWGVVKPAHAAPDDVVGLAVLAQATAARVGTTAFTLRDLQDDAFRSWFAGLQRAVAVPAGGASALTTMVQFGPARTDMVATTEAEAVTVLARAGERAVGLVPVELEPPLDVALVVAGADPEVTAAVEAVLRGSAARQVLTEAGWRVDGVPPSARTDAVARPPAAEPSAGALAALRATYREVVR
jgi:hypothetical protein